MASDPLATLVQKNRKRRNRKKKKKPQRVRGASSESSGEREKEKESSRARGSESPAAAVEIEYVTEEPEIHEPNFIFFRKIFEAFKVEGVGTGLEPGLCHCSIVRGDTKGLGFRAAASTAHG